MTNPTGDALVTVTTDELTFEFTPAQAMAIRAYVSRCEREFLRSLRAEFSQIPRFDNEPAVASDPRRITIIDAHSD